MSVALLQPLGLFGLAALVVPIALHLARRSEHRVTDFAALRWLRARARPRRNVRLVERGLLALRMLLVVALVLLLAEPAVERDERDGAWTLVASGVDPARIPGRDAGDRADWRWLAPGFPALGSPRPEAVAPVSSLLRELDSLLPRSTRITVWVPREMAGLDGARVQLGRPIAWRIAPGRTPLNKSRDPVPETFAVRAGADRTGALRYLRAAARVWSFEVARQQSTGATSVVESMRPAAPNVADSSALPRAGQPLVWLRAGELPATVRSWLEAGGTLLIEPRTPWPIQPESSAVVWRSESGTPLAFAQRVGRGRLVRLDRPLAAPELPALLQGSFARVLQGLLFPQESRADRAWARDVAPLLDRSQVAQSRSPMGANREQVPWLALLVAMLFLLERWMATSAHRWQPA